MTSGMPLEDQEMSPGDEKTSMWMWQDVFLFGCFEPSGMCLVNTLNMKCSPTPVMCWTLGPQLVALFLDILEALRGES